MIIEQLTRQTAVALLHTAFAEEKESFGLDPEELANHILIRRALSGHRGLLQLDASLDVPVIGLGASAHTYYPAVGKAIGANMILPEHAGVANAIGAVVGRVAMRQSLSVTSPAEGSYRVHFESGPVDYGAQTEALEAVEAHLSACTRSDAIAAGATDIEIVVSRNIKVVRVEARDVFVEASIEVEASGRPRFARH